MYREHNSNVAYYRLQGRLDGQHAPIKPTASAAKPTELELFIAIIKNRFRTSAAKFSLVGHPRIGTPQHPQLLPLVPEGVF